MMVVEIGGRLRRDREVGFGGVSVRGSR